MQHHALFGTFNIERAKTILFDCVHSPILGMVLGIDYWYQPVAMARKLGALGYSILPILRLPAAVITRVCRIFEYLGISGSLPEKGKTRVRWQCVSTPGHVCLILFSSEWF